MGKRQHNPGRGEATIVRKRFRLEIELREDLHSGTGVAAGALDSVQIRGRDGRPVIRASHIKGLLLDSAIELADLIPANKPLVNKLFGGKTEHNEHVRGRLLLQSLRADGPAKSVPWTSTARRAFDRCALDDTLHSTEYVAAGTRFSAQLELLDAGLEQFLCRCIRRLIRLGSHRSRGSGLVKTDLKPVHNVPSRTVNGQPGQNNLRLRLLLVNLDPLCLPVTGVPGNIIPTECYIRGQTLFGAIANWAIGQGKPVEQLFEAGRITALNAYPLPMPASKANISIGKEWDILPIPLDTKSGKPGPQRDKSWPWWAEDQAAPAQPLAPGEKPKRPGEREFLFRERPAGQWQRYEPRIDVHLRNNSGKWRRGEDKQQLFSMEEIAEDTLFLGELIFKDEGVAKRFANDFRPVLTGQSWLAVGRGGTPMEVQAGAWGAPHLHPPKKPDGPLTVRLVSDLIARGPHLGFFDKLDEHLLIDLAVADSSERDRLHKIEWECDTEKSESDHVEVRGFNATSGLPRATALAVRRGSCLTIMGPEKELKTLYAHLARLPALGERMHEGFGQFRLDLATFDIAPRGGIQIAEDESVSRREALLAAAKAAADGLVPGRDGNAPSPSQWMSLWQAVQAAPNHDRILAVFDQFKQRGDTLGGKAWNSVAFDRLREEVRRQRANALEETRLFLHASIRQCYREAKSAREAGN